MLSTRFPNLICDVDSLMEQIRPRIFEADNKIVLSSSQVDDLCPLIMRFS